MEDVLEIWRHQSLDGHFPKQAFKMPDGESDLIFTSRRMVVVGRARKEGTWWAWGMLAGPVGVLATGTAAALWEGYQRMTCDPKLSIDVLDQLVANGMALSVPYESLRCEVTPEKRSWDDYMAIIPDSHCLIAFYGVFASGNSSLSGALYERTGMSASAAAKKLQKVASLRIEARKQLPMMEMLAEPQRRVQELQLVPRPGTPAAGATTQPRSRDAHSFEPGHRLRKLDELYANGLISAEEHQEKRRQVIDEV